MKIDSVRFHNLWAFNPMYSIIWPGETICLDDGQSVLLLLLNSYLVEDFLELLELAELDQIQPRHVCDPLEWFGLHGLQVQRSPAWSRNTAITYHERNREHVATCFSSFSTSPPAILLVGMKKYNSIFYLVFNLIKPHLTLPQKNANKYCLKSLKNIITIITIIRSANKAPSI